MSDIFFIPIQEGESQFRDRGSRFLGFAYRVGDEKEVDERLSALRKQYHDARHHCYAWVIGEDQQAERANDDGEPSHSAGDPILGQIHSKELTNTLVVVVRYFGGTKLGVSGLINAYRTAAADALELAGRKKCMRMAWFELVYSYEQTSAVMRMIHDLELELGEQEFRENCSARVGIALSREKELNAQLKEYSERTILQNYTKIS